MTLQRRTASIASLTLALPNSSSAGPISIRSSVRSGSAPVSFCATSTPASSVRDFAFGLPTMTAVLMAADSPSQFQLYDSTAAAKGPAPRLAPRPFLRRRLIRVPLFRIPGATPMWLDRGRVLRRPLRQELRRRFGIGLGDAAEIAQPRDAIRDRRMGRKQPAEPRTFG